MSVFKFKELNEVCRALGLESKQIKKGVMWTGMTKFGHYARVPLHNHALGRDIPTGTAQKIAKELGFKNLGELKEYLNSVK